MLEKPVNTDLYAAIAMLMVTEPPPDVPQEMQNLWEEQRERLFKKYQEELTEFLHSRSMGTKEERHAILAQKANAGDPLSKAVLSYFQKGGTW